jgi:hypothetical protein
MMQYRELVRAGATLPRIQDVGWQAFSQADEDGILLYIFSLIGTTDRRCVEICAGPGFECNTANLILNHHWSGLLVDGDEKNVQLGRSFFEQQAGSYVFPPQYIHTWITRENINEIIESNDFDGQIDLLSIDMDGIDYYVWEELRRVVPRVVVAEFQCAVGPDRRCVVPYRPDYCGAEGPSIHFAGASLAAFRALARRRGYRFVGCNCYGFNAFFVREELCGELLPEADPAWWFAHPKVRREMRTVGPDLMGLPWIDI